MARGKFYTDEERAKMVSLRNDNPDKDYKWLAEKCISYGICVGRKADAIVTEYKRIKEREDAAEAVEEMKRQERMHQMQEDSVSEQITIAGISLPVDEKAEKYDDLLSTIFGHASLWEGTYEDGLHFNVPVIRDWIKDHEMERFNRRVNELLAIKYGA